MIQETTAIEQNLLVVPHRLIDLSQVIGTRTSFLDMMALVEERKAQIFANASKSAIVVTRPVNLGFARMFQILNDHPQLDIRIFTTVAAAEDWLIH